MTTWLAAIEANGFDGEVRTMMIHEAQHTRFPGYLPAGFECLRGPFADLGFDRLGLAAADLDAVLLAFVGTGVRVPGTNFRLRCVRPVLSVVEPADGNEAAILPDDWQRGVVPIVEPDTHSLCDTQPARGAGGTPAAGPAPAAHRPPAGAACTDSS